VKFPKGIQIAVIPDLRWHLFCIWQKVTSYLQQLVSLMSISNVCEHRVEFDVGRHVTTTVRPT